MGITQLYENIANNVAMITERRDQPEETRLAILNALHNQSSAHPVTGDLLWIVMVFENRLKAGKFDELLPEHKTALTAALQKLRERI